MKIIESKLPIIILSCQNCEIYCCHLDGYKSNTNALLNRLAIIEEIFINKPEHIQFRIWFNMDENRLEKTTMKLIANSICRFQKHIYKIGFVGLHGIAKWKFDYILKQAAGEYTITKAYFLDAELAKKWLI